MEELKEIYPVPPKPIDLSEKVVKGKLRMSFWKGFGQLVLAGGAAAGVLVVAGIWHDSQAGVKEPLSAIISDEKRVLAEVEKACFPKLGFGKNEATCKLWLRQYRAMEEYGYSDSDLFNPDAEGDAKAGEKRVQRLSKTGETPTLDPIKGSEATE